MHVRNKGRANHTRSARLGLATVLLVVLGLVLGGLPAPAAAAPRDPVDQTRPVPRRNLHPDARVRDRYIVVLKDNVADPRAVATELARAHGLAVRHLYRRAFKGFSARIPVQALGPLARDRRVVGIELDRLDQASAQDMPTGVNRIDADLNATARINGRDERVNVDVAVLDTGVGPHADLNIVGGTDCTDSGTVDDPHGHGTHVAGTVGALDNGIGVVGVAPGARIHAVKVLGPDNKGTRSDIMCGLEWVADRADVIEVANLSLGGTGSDSPNCGVSPFRVDFYHAAYCEVVRAGVTVVVSAGNSCLDAKNAVPAAYDEVITVSSLADYDGVSGGRAATQRGTCQRDNNGDGDKSDPGETIRDGDQPDDSLALHSNFGADVDLAAPGVGILSTVPVAVAASGLRWMNGTSMAAPHVAGAAALDIARNGRRSPATVKAALIAQREAAVLAGDADGRHEGIVKVGAPSLALSPRGGPVGEEVLVTLDNYRPFDTVTVRWYNGTTATTLGTATIDANGDGFVGVTVPAGAKGGHKIEGAGTSGSTFASFVVLPSLTLSPAKGGSSTRFAVALNGYAALETVTIKWYNGTTATTLKTVQADINGRATVTGLVPTGPNGSHKVEGVGNGGTIASATFSFCDPTPRQPRCHITVPPDPPTDPTAADGRERAGRDAETTRDRDTATTPPTAPSELRASERRGEVELRWTDNAADERAHRVYRRTVGERNERGDWERVSADLAPDATTYRQRRDLAAGTTYEYAVVAVNAAGESDRSNRARVTLPD